MPGADLLLSNSYDQLMANVVEGQHIGQGVVDGVECEHLAFRGAKADWQMWIERGARPLPRKVVVTTRDQPLAPEFIPAWYLARSSGIQFSGVVRLNFSTKARRSGSRVIPASSIRTFLP